MNAFHRVGISLLFAVVGFACSGVNDAAETELAARGGKHATGWQRVDPPEGFTFAGLEPSCSTAPNLQADPSGATLFPADYRFLVHEGDPRKLVIYFEGGGACWDVVSCIRAQSFFQAIPEDFDEQLAARSGIFDLDNPKNPVRNWTFVVVPYCTGDLHAGTRDTTYGGFTIRHRGLVNAEAVLAWTTEHFPDARKVLVTGSSAGGYGARNNQARIAELYPDARLVHFGDASTLSPSPAVVELLQANWGAQSVVGSVAEYPALAERYPDVHFGLYGTQRDDVLTAFRGLFCATVPSLEVGCSGCPVCEFEDDTTAELEIASQARNFRYYIAAGSLHTILARPEFYTEDSAGVRFVKWFSQLVHASGRSPVPRSVACPECLETCPRDLLCPSAP